MTTALTSFQLKNITAGYGLDVVLRDLNLEIEGGEFLALLGPSGCGKTTLLKVIAGLLEPTQGDLLFGDQVLTQVQAERREAAMVFQKPLLFPHLSVSENVAFGLRMRKTPRAESERRVAEALQIVQLEGYGRRRPRELSGGQEQRVSLARALVTKPRVLLLDEPFSALDVGLRAEMRSLVRDLQKRLRITTVFVTHDQEEAVTIADRIALLLDGRLEQVGRPRDFYTSPRTPEAARFFGWKVFAGELRGGLIETVLGYVEAPRSYTNNGAGSPASIAFHPAGVRFSDPGGAPQPGLSFQGTIEGIVELGARVRYILALRSGDVLEIEKEISAVPGDITSCESGAEISVFVPANAIRFF